MHTLQSKSNNIVQQKFDIHRIHQILSINIEESPCFKNASIAPKNVAIGQCGL